MPNCYKNSSSECKCLFGHNKKSKNIRYTSAYKILCSPSQSRAFVSSLSALGSDEVTRAPWHPHCTSRTVLMRSPPFPDSVHPTFRLLGESREARGGRGWGVSYQLRLQHLTSPPATSSACVGRVASGAANYSCHLRGLSYCMRQNKKAWLRKSAPKSSTTHLLETCKLFILQG